jgi:chaperonin GroES
VAKETSEQTAQKASAKSTPKIAPQLAEKTPIQMLHDRILVDLDHEAGERRSSGGIVIPATAALGARRLSWARVVGVGPGVRHVEVADRVLFDPEDKAEVEVAGEIYIVMRERDLHAVAAQRVGDSATGLYL